MFQVDAFTSRLFGGNPAAVIPLESWLADETMQAIAFENNVAETAFFVPENDGFRLRWFAPNVEVKLCGHATLASAYVLFHILEPGRTEARFETLSGTLTVTSKNERLVMDFPRWTLEALESVPKELEHALRKTPTQAFAVKEGGNFFVVFGSERDVRALAPDFKDLAKLEAGVIATAPGENSDASCATSRRFMASTRTPARARSTAR